MVRDIVCGMTLDPRKAEAMTTSRAWSLGQVVAQRGMILVTGACSGLPYECARREMAGADG